MSTERGSGRATRMVALAELGDPTRLQSLAEAIFGGGSRAPGWFARKLVRECVDPALSVVAVDDARSIDDARAWLGYVLVGTPPSLGDAARTAGTGVREDARGCGVGTRLLDAAADRVREKGLRALQLLADPEVVPFYRTRGFVLLQRVVTLTRPTLGDARVVSEPAAESSAPDDDATRKSIVQWLPEAWAGTEAALRRTVQWPGGAARLSREGSAWLVHRLTLEPGVADPSDGALALLRHLPAGRAVILPLLPEDNAVTAQLIAAGWHALQRGALLSRTL